jgi:hypothetical protein
MTGTKSLLFFLLIVVIHSSSYAQFEIDSLTLPKNALSLNVTPILRLTGDHNDQGWFGLVYRRNLESKQGRIKVQFNQFEDTQFINTNLVVFEDSTQVFSSNVKYDDSYQIGFGYEYGKFYKRFHWYTGLELMWMIEQSDFSSEPLYRYSSDYFIANPMPIGSLWQRDKPIAEMDSTMFVSGKWTKESFGLGLPLGLSARISDHFEVSAQWLVQLWFQTVRSEGTEFFTGEVSKFEANNVLLNTRSGELLLTYQF